MAIPRDDVPPTERLAHRLLDALNFDRRFDNRYSKILGDSPLAANQSDAVRERIKALAEERRKRVNPGVIRPAMAAYYAEKLSDDDLKTLIAFFESPVGQRFVAVWESDHESVRRVIAEARNKTDHR